MNAFMDDIPFLKICFKLSRKILHPKEGGFGGGGANGAGRRPNRIRMLIFVSYVTNFDIDSVKVVLAVGTFTKLGLNHLK